MNNNQQTTESSLPKKGMDARQKQLLKKYAVFTVMVIAFAACMWLIFAPSDKDKEGEAAGMGLNVDIPMPKEEAIIGDKQNAYEQDQAKQSRQEKMRTLNDFSALMGGDKNQHQPSDYANPAPPSAYKPTQPTSSIQSSANAYKDINRTLGTFYENPKVDPEKERLTKELEELKTRMSDNESKKNSVDEQLAIMEKSYQMAAKYLPAGTVPEAAPKPTSSGKTVVVPIEQVTVRTVSALQQDVPESEFMASVGKPRNMGFLTATAEEASEAKNTITACVHDDQTLTEGQSVRLRLLEPLKAGRMLVPRNTIVTGAAKLQGERLEITVSSLEYGGTILPVELQVYDTDGQRGIFIPNSMEVNAAKEVVSNLGTSAGTSISLTGSPQQQLAADMGRGVIQGASQFLSKKMQVVKVNLKAGYRIMLLPKSN